MLVYLVCGFSTKQIHLWQVGDNMYILHKAKNLLVYKGTITGLRISAVDGTAFIDNAGATIPTYADGNHLIEIYDSSNRMLKGVLKAAGTSETLGDNPVALASFNFTSGWTTTGTASITDSDTYVSNAVGDGIRVESFFTPLSLYRSSFTGSTSTGNTTIVDLATSTNIYATINEGNSYRTNVTFVALKLRNSQAATTDITAITVQQVLAPSSSGATIVSAKGGTTYNFAYKHASFTYNAASYYCVIRAIR